MSRLKCATSVLLCVYIMSPLLLHMYPNIIYVYEYIHTHTHMYMNTYTHMSRLKCATSVLLCVFIMSPLLLFMYPKIIKGSRVTVVALNQYGAIL